MNKKQSFLIKEINDDEITTLNFIYGSGNPNLVAVGLKSNKESFPRAKIYYLEKKDRTYDIVHSKLETNKNVIDVLFLYKGKYLATLVEMIPKKKYCISVFYISSERCVWYTIVDEHINSLEKLSVSQTKFSACGPKYFTMFSITTEDKNMKVKELEKEGRDIRMALNLEQNTITDHCWIKGDNQLIFSTQLSLFIFKEYDFTQKLDYEFPGEELKKILENSGTVSNEDQETQLQITNALNYFIEQNEDLDDLRFGDNQYLKETREAERKNPANVLVNELKRDFALEELEEITEEDEEIEELKKEEGEEEEISVREEEATSSPKSQSQAQSEDPNELEEQNSPKLVLNSKPRQSMLQNQKPKIPILDTIENPYIRKLMIPFISILEEARSLKLEYKKKQKEILKKTKKSQLEFSEQNLALYERQKDKIGYLCIMRYILRKKNIHINSLCGREAGFAVGLHGIGIISLFREDGASYVMESNSQIETGDIDSILHLSSSMDNSHIAVSVRKKRSGVSVRNVADDASFGNLDIFIFNAQLVDAIKVSYKEPYEPLYEFGAHTGKIQNLAVLPTKLMVGSLGSDETVKFWSFGGEDKQLFSFPFRFEALSFAIHPHCVQCAVGDRLGLRIFLILEDRLQEVLMANITKPCNAVQYSENGKYLAVGLGFEVKILDPFTLKEITSLRIPNEITHIKFLYRDNFILAQTNSLINVWNVNKNWEILFEHVAEQTSKEKYYASVDYDAELDMLVCCEVLQKEDPTDEENKGEGFFKIFKNLGGDMVFEKELKEECFTKVLICKRLQSAFIGTSTGKVCTYLWPMIQMDSSDFEMTEAGPHQLAVTDLVVSHDFDYLISASEDGSIYFFELHEMRNGKMITRADYLESIKEEAESNVPVLAKISNLYNLNEFAMLSNEILDVSFENFVFGFFE